MTDADNTDDLVLLANASDKAESLLHSLKQAVRNIGLYVNAKETWFTSFKEDSIIS